MTSDRGSKDQACPFCWGAGSYVRFGMPSICPVCMGRGFVVIEDEVTEQRLKRATIESGKHLGCLLAFLGLFALLAVLLMLAGVTLLLLH